MFHFTTFQVRTTQSISYQIAGLSDSGDVVGSDFTIVLSERAGSFSYSIPSGTLVQFAGSQPQPSGGQAKSVTFDVNDSGQVVGEYNAGSNTPLDEGFLYSNGTLTSVVVPGSSLTTPQGITSSGTIVGFFADGSGADHGFIRTPGGTYSTFDVPAAWGGHNTEFVDVNDNGEVLGTYFDSGNVERSFEYNTTTGIYTQLIFSGDQTVLTRINDLGQAIGSYVDGSGVSHGLFLDGSSFTVIDDPLAKPGGTTVADVNDKGQIVGTYVDSGGEFHGFLYANGIYQTIDEPGVIGFTKVDAINDLGQIAGTAGAPFYATPNTPYDLNADGVSDLLFQNNGTPQIWLWNGTAVTSQTTFPNPGASWHIVTSRDANADGMSDLIWQNSDGTPGVWLMNGTTPIAEVGLANPRTLLAHRRERRQQRRRQVRPDLAEHRRHARRLADERHHADRGGRPRQSRGELESRRRGRLQQRRQGRHPAAG